MYYQRLSAPDYGLVPGDLGFWKFFNNAAPPKTVPSGPESPSYRNEAGRLNLGWIKSEIMGWI